MWTDVASHNTRDDCWMVIEGKVYDITRFLDEHPGGEEVLLEQAGTDATEAFEEIGHSDDARDLLKTFFVADLSDKSKPPPKAANKVAPATSTSSEGRKASQTNVTSILFGLIPVVGAIAFIAYKVLEQKA
ncbi:hypothetical protein HK101_002708 [Irineochytrium annulatum]|nr:hypothetical protein HK101_002708 [Irineochytrium annulatum]